MRGRALPIQRRDGRTGMSRERCCSRKKNRNLASGNVYPNESK